MKKNFIGNIDYITIDLDEFINNNSFENLSVVFFDEFDIEGSTIFILIVDIN